MALGLRTMVIPTQRDDTLYMYTRAKGGGAPQARVRKEWVMHLQVRRACGYGRACMRVCDIYAHGTRAAAHARAGCCPRSRTCRARARTQAGAGLVADSVPEAEYEETVNKAAALGRAIDLAEQAFVAPHL